LICGTVWILQKNYKNFSTICRTDLIMHFLRISALNIHITVVLFSKFLQRCVPYTVDGFNFVEMPELLLPPIPAPRILEIAMK
jgi:hypothetical protein